MSSIAGDIKSVPQTFSSWDLCMSKAYCKWPAIIGIAIASLIIFSILWCFARCLCCGASCLCSCFRCCGCLESCTRPRGSNESRHKDQYAPVQNQQPMPYQGYQAPPMMYGAVPQFATFDASSKKVHEDSLPAMPSWDTAHTRRVEDDSQDMEMKHLEHQASGGLPPRQPNAYAPVSHAPVSPMRSPVHSPYDQQDSYMHGAQPYGSDLGAQPLNHSQYAQEQDQAYAHGNPLSPAPTYTSGPAPTYRTTQQPQRPLLNMNNTQSYRSDRYAATSPPHQQQWSPVESTRYEPTEYAPSASNGYHNNTDNGNNMTGGQRPPSFQSFGGPGAAGSRQSYQPPAGQARPPSFLQVGRKPVGGSVREL